MEEKYSKRNLLLLINQKLDTMAKAAQERFDLINSRLDAITNDIAADYQKLLDEIRSGSISEESLARAEANIAKLEELGASVADSPDNGDSPADSPETP